MGGTMVQDGMTIDRDVDIPADRGLVLKGDVVRPGSRGACPVLLSYGLQRCS